MTESEKRTPKLGMIDVNRFWARLILLYLVSAILPYFAPMIPHFMTAAGEMVWIGLCIFFYRKRK